ncbi:MAG TPA: hypothetical protein PK711_02320 [Bacteroidales bacterium]|nr:hypothetical protein [Bacteroidales bacterium]HRZ20246.1 hypothetical protein [Bacteroidales bacterium]
MKELMIFLTGLAFAVNVCAQNNYQEEQPFKEKFLLELNYSFLDADLKLLTMTKHSLWDGQDFGTLELDQDEIDSLNSFVDYKDLLHGLSLAAGMVLLDKPGNKWYIEGHLTIGLTRREYTVINNKSKTTDLIINSENISPWYGIGFNFRYHFDAKWGLALSPHTVYSFGTTKAIDDNLNPVVEFMDETRKNTFDLSYTWVNLLASFAHKKFTIMAGPGFYLCYSRNEYNIVRTQQEDGQTYEDTVISTLKSGTFINGSIQFDWRFNDHFLFSAGAGLSNDISATARIVYFL